MGEREILIIKERIHLVSSHILYILPLLHYSTKLYNTTTQYTRTTTTTTTTITTTTLYTTTTKTSSTNTIHYYHYHSPAAALCVRIRLNRSPARAPASSLRSSGAWYLYNSSSVCSTDRISVYTVHLIYSKLVIGYIYYI